MGPFRPPLHRTADGIMPPDTLYCRFDNYSSHHILGACPLSTQGGNRLFTGRQRARSSPVEPYKAPAGAEAGWTPTPASKGRGDSVVPRR